MKKLFYTYGFLFKGIRTVGTCTLLLYSFSVLVSGSSSVFTSYILKNIVSVLENAFNNKYTLHYLSLLIFISIYTGFNIFESALNRFNMATNRILGMHLSQNIKIKIVKKIQNIEHKIFYNPDFQNDYTSVLSSSYSEPMQLVTSTFHSIVSIIQISEIVFIMVKFNFAVLLIFSPFLFIDTVIQFKTQHKYISIWDLQSKSMRKYSYYFNTMTKNESLKELQTFEMYDYFSEKMHRAFLDNVLIWKEFGKKEILRNICGQLFTCIGLTMSVFYLTVNAIKHNCSIADFVFYLNLIFNFQIVCRRLIQEASIGYKGVLFINKLMDFLKMNNHIKCGKISIVKDKAAILEFKNVSFRYPGNREYSVENINLKFEKGQKVCIVGENGCGKSTLINLILRMYEPNEGKILLNNIDIAKYDLSEYRGNILPIFQNFQKYAISLKDYISLKDTDECSSKILENLKKATKLSNALNFIDSLPEGFDTILTKTFDLSGLELSGGQWQRLVISRVFFSKAPILIFDEPTSSLDPISEKSVFEKIYEIKDKLIIFITHRTSNLKYADKIVFMHQGRVLAIGTHSELLNNCSLYEKLINTQN